MEYIQTRKCPRKLDFEIQMGQSIPAKRPDLVLIDKKKRTGQLQNFAVPADHRENKNRKILRSCQ